MNGPQTWLVILGITAVLYFIVSRPMLTRWIDRGVQRSLERDASFHLWGGEPGTRPPKGHRACRDCTYFYPDADLDHEGVCPDCRQHDDDLQAMLDYAYEHDAVFVVQPCSHSNVEWLVDEVAGVVTLVCSDCRVDLVTEAFDEWLAPAEPEQEDHR